MTEAASPDDIPSWSRAFGRGISSSVRRNFARRSDEVDGSIRTVSVAFLANLVVAAAKYIAFVMSGSSSILAEALHSTSVTVNQALLLRGRLSSMHPPTQLHPFGFGQARYFWAFVVSIVIFGIGAVLSIGHGILALGPPSHVLESPWIPIGALTVGLVMDGASFLQAVQQASNEKGELSYWQYVKQSKNPEVPLVMLEDTAAVIGLGFAYAGIALSVTTGNPVYDAIGSMLIGLLLATVSFIMAREMKGLLLGESATQDQASAIREVLTDNEGVRDVVYFRTLHVGPEHLLVEAKLAFRRDMQFAAIAEEINRMEAVIRDRVPAAWTISIEPGMAEEHDTQVPGYQSEDGPTSS